MPTSAGFYATAGSVNNATTEAAFQIAVWEIAYEATGTASNLTSGAATFTGGTALSSGALALASTWLLNLAGSGPSIGAREPTAPGCDLRACSGALDGASDGGRAAGRDRRRAQEGRAKS
jgi:hypothetical protein